MGPYTKSYRKLAENCAYGDQDALGIVAELLIDKGIEGVLHRKNILQPQLQYAGTSIQDHRQYASNCVILFGGLTR